jgi:antitoxin component of MazEF toxin-antitoxin module
LLVLRSNKKLVMTETILSIKHCANSLGVPLPQAITRAARLHAYQQRPMLVECGRVIIEPPSLSESQAGSLSLEDRLKRFDATRHGGEAMVVTPIGAERW